MDLKKNQIYYIFTRYYSYPNEYNLESYNNLKHLVYVDRINRMDEGTTYFFHDPLDTDAPEESFSEYEIDVSVFETQIDFLKYVLKTSINYKIPVTNSLKNVINQSHIDSPEQWV